MCSFRKGKPQAFRIYTSILVLTSKQMRYYSYWPMLFIAFTLAYQSLLPCSLKNMSASIFVFPSFHTQTSHSSCSLDITSRNIELFLNFSPGFSCAFPVARVHAPTQPSLVMGASPERTAHFLLMHPAPTPPQPDPSFIF